MTESRRGRLRAFAAAHPVLLVGLLLALLDLLLVYPAVLGGRVLGSEDSLLFNAPLSILRPTGLLHPSNYLLTDAVEVFHPDLGWAREMLRSGRLPLWNPDVFDGWPVFASQQTAILYPPNLLAYLLPFWPALGLIAVVKTLIAGAGTWWLCRRLRLGMAASVLAAIAYSLGSYFVIWLEHPQTNVYALIPWLLGAVDLVCARRRVADAAALAAVVGLCVLGGHPESTAIAGLASLAFAAFGLGGVTGAGARWRAGGLLAGAGLLGAAAGAVMLLPLAELAAQAPRLARGGGSGLPERALLGLLMPDLWGRPDRAFELAGPSNYAERTFYVGALPLMLAAAGLGRLRDRSHRFFVGLLLGAGVLAIHVPVLTKAVDNLPGLSYVALTRALILVALSLAVLAGFGLQSLLEASPERRRLMLVLAAVVAVAPLAAWLGSHGGPLDAVPRFDDLAPSLWGSARTQAQTGGAAATRWLLFAVPAFSLLWWLVRSLRSGRGRAATAALALAAGLAAVDLLALGHGYHPAIPQALAAPAPTPTLVAARADQGSGRTLGFNEYLIPSAGLRYALREPRGHGLPALGRHLALWNGLGGEGFQDTRLRPDDPRAARLLDDFGVRVLVTSPGQRPPAILRLVARRPDGDVYLNPGALPRAYLAGSWRPAASRQAALSETLAREPHELRAAPVIEGVPPPVGRPAGGAGSATFVEDGADLVSVRVAAPRPAFLVLLDSYYPGWTATVDGRRTTIHPANEAFRAVAVPAGRHLVVFRYRPASVVVGGGLSAAAWLVIVALLGGSRVLRRRRARRADRG